MTSPASIVFPRPTSSASSAPFESGERKCEERCVNLMRVEIDLSAGNRASELLTLSDGARLVSS